jgi:hypothetical protein
MQDSTHGRVGPRKVSGSRIATPFAPPRPGNADEMPSTSPMIMKAIVFHVSRTLKPWSNGPEGFHRDPRWEGRFQNPSAITSNAM